MTALKAITSYSPTVLSKFGIKVDPAKTSAVKTYPVPKNVKEVLSFLELCNYYRKFVHNYSNIATPLTQLTHTNRQLVWNPYCQVAFETLKENLVSASILVFSVFNRPFVLSVDASDNAVGYVLGQINLETNL